MLELLRTVLPDPPPANTGSYEAVVVKTTPELHVVIPVFDRTHQWGPCTLLAGAPDPPVVGERVLATITSGPSATIWLHQVAS